MKKQIIFMMNQNYPFEEFKSNLKDNSLVLIRKVYRTPQKERRNLMQKIAILENLKNETMIKLQSIVEQEESVHLLFEHIPIKLETWLANINQQLIKNIRNQVIKFSSFLADKNIKIRFSLQNIGMDNHYKAKYFLDLDFNICDKLHKAKLKSQYIKQIINLFKPYFKDKSIKTQQSEYFFSKKQKKMLMPLFTTFQTKQLDRKNERENTKVSSNAQQFDVNILKGSLKNNDKKKSRDDKWNLSNDSQANLAQYKFLDTADAKIQDNEAFEKVYSSSKLNQTSYFRLSKDFNQSQSIQRYSQMNIIRKYFINQEKLKLNMRIKNVIQKSKTVIHKFKSIEWKNSLNNNIKGQG